LKNKAFKENAIWQKQGLWLQKCEDLTCARVQASKRRLCELQAMSLNRPEGSEASRPMGSLNLPWQGFSEPWQGFPRLAKASSHGKAQARKARSLKSRLQGFEARLRGFEASKPK
jgi:hypothetical protein